MADASQPSPTGNLSEAARAAVAGVNVALPATVVSFDAETQTVSIQVVPCFRRKVGGQVSCYQPPQLHAVPVLFPGAGDYSDTWPLAAGDTGIALFCDRSLDEWKSTAAASTEPQDQRRHNITDAVFLPAGRSPADPIPADGIDAAARVIRAPLLKLGSASATDYVALASLVLAELNALRAELLLHTHPTGVGPSGPAIGIGATSGSVAATKVKAE
jgi:hypothetical protein